MSNSLFSFKRRSSSTVSSNEIVAPATTENFTKDLENLPPEALTKKIWNFLKKSRAFSSYQYEDVVKLAADLETWEMPEELQKSFPYYQAGYDQYDRPIWVLEMADCDFLSITNKGKDILPVLEKSIFLAVYRMIKSMHEKDTPDREITQCVFLSDFKGFRMSQVADPQCLTFLIRMARMYRELAVEITGMSIVVNMSLLVQTVSKIFRQIFRSMMDRIIIYGTNADKWVPHVRELLPLEVIPPSFGGDENFIPLRQYGYPEKFRKRSIIITAEEEKPRV